MKKESRFDLGIAFNVFPQEIRTLIYMTNPIESFNRQMRKVTKSKSVFRNDTASLKMLYLVTTDVMKKWMSQKIWLLF